MKKYYLGLSLLCSALVFSACGGTGSTKDASTSKAAATDTASIKLKDGSYVLQEGEQVSEGQGYLALELTIKNNTKKSLNVSNYDMTLYDSEDNQIKESDFYSNYDEDFKSFSGDNISGGKSTTGYIVFKVEKDKKYELHYKPSVVDSDGDDEKDVQIKVDASKYNDQTKSFENTAASYIKQVFYGAAEDKSVKDVLPIGNTIADDHSKFNTDFANALKEEFSSYTPSTAELNKVVASYESENSKKAKIEYAIDEMTPNEAVVYVKPTVLFFDNIDTDKTTDDFVNQNQGKYDDYDKAEQDAEKYLLQQLPTLITQTTASESEYVSGDGYRLLLKKENDKWTINTEDTDDNYDYESMYSDFMGGLGSY